MPNNDLLNYKPGMTLDTPVPITLAAADWICMMSWLVAQNLDGVTHIVLGQIAHQITEQVYDQASVKAATAAYYEHAEEEASPIIRTLRKMPTPDNLAESLSDIFPPGTIFVVECHECHSSDEYPALPVAGELTCGHTGPRHLVRVI